jgi:hypothetical protein
MIENEQASSGHVPSSAIPAIMWSITQGAKNSQTLWKKLKKMDPGLEEHFLSNYDDSPLLEGFDDGLLVISWDYQCIESFQVYQPLRFAGTVIPHNGLFQDKNQQEIEYQLGKDWKIIDHHFEESRH